MNEEGFKGQFPKFEVGKNVISPEYGEVRILRQGREDDSYIVVTGDGQEFEVMGQTLKSVGEEEEEEETEE